MPSHRSPKQTRTLIREGADLGNTVRNERQKTVFLGELSRLRRVEVGQAIEDGKKIVQKSKTLCERRAPGRHMKRAS